jgi:hypothetical protein
VSYCQDADLLALVVRPSNLQPLTLGQTGPMRQVVSDDMDTYFRGRWGYSAVPLIAWDTSITYYAAVETTVRLYTLRGINPKSEDAKILTGLHDQWKSFCDAVQRQQRHPLVTLANLQSPGGAQPIVSSSSVVDLSTGATRTNRGW